MSAALAIGLVGLLALSGSARGRSARLRFDTSGSRSVFLDENSKTRTQSVPNQSFTRSAVLSPAEASRKALSELRSMGGAHRPPEAVDALRVVTAGHKKVLWEMLERACSFSKQRTSQLITNLLTYFSLIAGM